MYQHLNLHLNMISTEIKRCHLLTKTARRFLLTIFNLSKNFRGSASGQNLKTARRGPKTAAAATFNLRDFGGGGERTDGRTRRRRTRTDDRRGRTIDGRWLHPKREESPGIIPVCMCDCEIIRTAVRGANRRRTYCSNCTPFGVRDEKES